MKIHVLRADTERTAQTRAHCAVCETEFELGPVYAWLVVGGYGPDDLCERCLRGLCEFARSENLDVAWKDAHTAYVGARSRYVEPVSTHEALLAMSEADQLGVYAEAYLTPAY